MGFLNARAILISLLTVVVIYAVSLAAWMAVRTPYALAAAKAVTLLYPVAGLRGGVSAEPERLTTVVYILQNPRTGGWARVRQRFLDFSDIPLAVAVGLGLPFLSWRRRVAATAVACLTVFACHVGLMLWSAGRLADCLADPAIDRAALDAALYEVSNQATGYGNISAVVTLILAAAASALLFPRAGAPAATQDSIADNAEQVEHSAPAVHPAPAPPPTAKPANLL